MYTFPTDIKKIKTRIRSYERALKKEKKTYGDYDDGYGKRYLLGPLYLLASDVEGAINHYKWFEEEFPDDSGEPLDILCWALALYKANKKQEASKKLLQAMLSNLYLIPFLLGEDQDIYDMWHPSNRDFKEYCDYMPEELMGLWSEEEKTWASSLYHSAQFTKIRNRYIEIYKQLETEKDKSKRRAIIEEAYQLQNSLIEID